VDVKDHRAVFILKHRAGRKSPFAPDTEPATTHQALAKLARITSCFPVAFQQVHMEDIAPQDDGPADARLQQWGRIGKEAYFLDGGVLDNKPFTYTIREIFYRLADRKVDRKLFYVEPDPERFAKVDSKPFKPSVLQAALKSLVAIPSYESISEDLKLLSDRNEKLRRYNWLMNQYNSEPRDEAAKASFLETDLRLYTQIRLMELSEQVVRGVLRRN
jgi:hypothetical protein